MKTISVHDAKTNLSKYLAEIEATGEEMVIARRNKPVARLVPAEKEKLDRSEMFGCLAGYMSEEAVEYLTDPKLDKEIENDFLGVLNENDGGSEKKL
jgi:prevent-host-death family protein